MVNVEQAKRLASDIFSGTASPAHQRDPERIGRYRITRRIAIGGMGTVYAAEEERPHRAVAIKVLKPAIDPETAIRRFWLEAEVLGHLRHPGIAHIYEASIHEDGATALPYIVMEFVPGALPISVYCDTHNIDTRGRLELFAEACEAVQHAHQKGVIHRDLKPANVLVDAVGRPKVIDFGIARATNPEISSGTLTQGHQLLGSMPYMSPEQCVSGPCGVDTRSDVYSMGVVLYELLCGRLPRDLTGCSALEGARRIREDAPVSPSTVRQELRGDLEAILLVALARDPEKRYRSIVDLVLDIRHHLRGDPISARPPSRWERAVRWVARHPVRTTAAAFFLVGILTAAGAVALTSWYSRMTPSQIRLREDGRLATLHDVRGKTLHLWEADPENGIVFGDLVEQPSWLLSARLAIIGYSEIAGETHRGSICVFDAREPRGDPIWSDRVAQDEIVPSLDNQVVLAECFGVAAARVTDFFPGRPGQELLVVFQHSPSSPFVVRIYDLDGNRLYQIIHDGAYTDWMWLPVTGQLVFLASNSEVYWSRRDHPLATNVKSAHPRVVFSVRPTLGHLGMKWTSPDPRGDDATLLWYRCILPPAFSDRYTGFELSPAVPPHYSPRSFQLSLHHEDGGVLWRVVNEHGIAGAADASDERDLAEDGDVEFFELGDLPPVKSFSPPER